MKKFILALVVLMTSLQADYWETLQGEKGYLTISSICTDPYLRTIQFFITEDQDAPMLLTVTHNDTPIIEEDPWEPGDLVFFKLLGEEYYYVTNLRTQSTVIVVEPLGLQHQ